MQEIKCPKCGEVFAVDESGYAQIVQQIRDREFEKELKRREKDLEEKKESDLEIIRLKQEEELNRKLSDQKLELSEKDKMIEQLKGKLKNSDTEKELAVSRALHEKEQEIAEKINQITELEGRLSSKDNESRLQVETLQKQHENELKLKEEQIEYYKDFKARLSTKMVGESLEQHCLNQFNSLRMTAFPTAYFEKDNDVRTGSKGDFIFRDSVDGVEFISIMFEMKNEMDTTATKKKNEDFFKELDKDRKEKNSC